MKPKQACRINMILRYLFISCVVVLGVISIIASGGGGGDAGGGGGGSASEISNFSYSPSSAIEGSGGGTIPVTGTFDFVDSDGNVSTLTLSIFDSNDNLLDSSTDPIEGISGLTSGTIEGVYDINTSVVGDYTFEIYITDATNLSSNILSGMFTVIHDDTQDLDTTFGNGGIALYESTLDYADEEGRSIAIQTDGKILVAGYTYNGFNNDVLILKYNSDGTLDNTFGTNGVVLFDVGRHEEAYAISLQADGKIVLVGYSWEMDKNVLVLRYNSDGTLDPTFGTNGVVTTDVEHHDYGYALALQPDGKIVVAGETSIPTDRYAMVLRYNSDGTLDATFGTNGVIIYDGIGEDIAYGVSLQSDGKIVVTGSTSEAYPRISFTHTLILRYNSDGTFDNSFGTNGVVIYENVYEAGKAVKIQPDGKILVGGSIFDPYNCENNAVLMLRLIDDGSLDNTFGINGVAIYKRDQCDSIYGNSFTLQPDGKIVVVGGSNSNIMVLRYNIDGTLDTSFSGDGVGMYSSGDIAITQGHGVALQTDGKIVVTGSSSLHDNYSDQAVLTIRIIGQ